jgi:dipeptidyl aminopeptidase/acylaminoacyl peptidase
MSRAVSVLLKSLKWLVVLALVLIVLIAVWIGYVVASFDTTTLPARHGQVDVVLDAPDGAPRPLIVGLGGAEGGNGWQSRRWSNQRQRFLDQGYAFLSLGYFGTPTTPEKLDRIALDGVSRAIRDAQASPNVADECVILIGGSKGAELALTLASHDESIDAVVAMAPSDTVFPAHTDAMITSSWSLDGEPLPFAPMPWAATWDLVRGDIGAVMARILAQPEAAAARIPAERIQGPLLLVSSKGDEMWPATRMAERMTAALDAAHFAHAHEHLAVDGGHTAVVDHFDAVERFLAEHVMTLPQCGGAPNPP